MQPALIIARLIGPVLAVPFVGLGTLPLALGGFISFKGYTAESRAIQSETAQ